MKKTITALLLAAALVFGSVGAQAEESALGRLILSVKEQLGIGDEYSQFDTDRYYEGADVLYWNLSWSGKQGGVYVVCDPDGVIYDYSRYDFSEEDGWEGNFAPRLYDEEPERYRPAAEAFLGRVIPEGWGWIIEDSAVQTRNYRPYAYGFTGRLTRGGYETEISLSVIVRVADGAVTSYWRSDIYIAYASFDAPEKLSDAGAARALLEKDLRMQLHYVSDEPGKAVLRYRVCYDGTILVDAATGNPLERGDSPGNGEAPASEEGMSDATAKGGDDTEVQRAALTDVERTGIRTAEGLLGPEELDAAARAITEFGLTDSYALARIDVRTEGEGRFVAYLRYLCALDRDTLIRTYGYESDVLDRAEAEEHVFCIEKNVCLDAQTGALLSLYTSYPCNYRETGFTYPDREETEMAAVADAFVERLFPERLEETVSVEGRFDNNTDWYDPHWHYRYVRGANGVPYEANWLAVTVNIENGLVDSYSSAWDEEIEFESTEGIISAEEALARWLECQETALRFVDVPDHYADYTCVYRAVLCYRLAAGEEILGVNAADGTVVVRREEQARYAYDDLEGHPAREAVETLASHGIGLEGGSFRPDEEITLRDWLILLLRAGGYGWINENESDEDLAQMARREGIPLPGAELSAPVERAAAVRMLMQMAGYGKAAGLREAFVCGFADDDLLGEDFGCVAIAKAMGVAAADERGCFRPRERATRAEAAQMLFGFLVRTV